jgi:hypothetical protein
LGQNQDKIDFNVRIFKPGDEAKIVSLLQKVLPPWPLFDINCSPADHWRWKFLDNPVNFSANTSGHIPIAVAEYNGDIIGIDSGIFIDVKVGDSRYLGYHAAETGVDEKFRGQGVFSKINKLNQIITKEEGCALRYGLSSNPIILSKKHKDPTSFPFPHPIKYLIRINDVKKHFENTFADESSRRRLFLKAGVYGLTLKHKLTNINPKPLKTKVEIKEITRFDKNIDAFYNKVKPHYFFIVEKTAKYLNWRYCDKRGGEFHSWAAIEDGELVGYVVLRVNKANQNYHLGYVMDLSTLDSRGDIIESLVRFTIEWFDSLDVNVIHAQLIGGNLHERYYTKYGFLDSRSKTNLTYRNYDVGIEDLEKFNGASPSMLHYNYGESDAI